MSEAVTTAIFRAVVHDVADPEKRGRLRAVIPGALGDAPSAWAEPALPTKTPLNWKVGDRVWIFFEAGDVNKPVYMARMQIKQGDLDVGILNADMLLANNAFIDALNATDFTAVTITGPTIQTNAEPDLGIHLDEAGLRAYGPNGGAPFMNVDPARGLAIVAGEIKAHSFTVSSSDPDAPPTTSLGGTTEIAVGGRLKLTGTTTPPASAPILDTGYDTLQFTNDGRWGQRRGWVTDGEFWYTARVTTNSVRDLLVEKWNPDGTFNSRSINAYSDCDMLSGVTFDGQYLWTLARHGGPDWILRPWHPNMTSYNFLPWWQWDPQATPRPPALGFDDVSRQFIIARVGVTDTNIRIQRVTVGATAYRGVAIEDALVTDVTWDEPLTSVYFGSADFDDLGTPRYMVDSANSNQNRVIHPDGSQSIEEKWRTGVTLKVGTAWDGTQFVSMDTTGKMRYYTQMGRSVPLDSPLRKKWVSNTLVKVDGATTYETPQSPRASILVENRARLVARTSPIVNAGVNSPDRVRVYVGEGDTDPGRASMVRQGDPAPGITDFTFVSLDRVPHSSKAPPETNTFLEGEGALLVDMYDQVVIDEKGRHVNVRRGRVTTDTHVVGTVLTTPVVFDQPFLPGVVPDVFLQVNTSNSPHYYDYDAQNVTNEGFDLKTVRNTNTGALTVVYRAYMP